MKFSILNSLLTQVVVVSDTTNKGETSETLKHHVYLIINTMMSLAPIAAEPCKLCAPKIPELAAIDRVNHGPSEWPPSALCTIKSR